MSRYKCLPCGVEWSVENMAPVCVSCYCDIKLRLASTETTLVKSEELRLEAGRAWEACGDELLKVRKELDKAEAVVEAARRVKAQFESLKLEQYEKLVLGQTLESAAKNWAKGFDNYVDFEELFSRLVAYNAQEEGL